MEASSCPKSISPFVLWLGKFAISMYPVYMFLNDNQYMQCTSKRKRNETNG